MKFSSAPTSEKVPLHERLIVALDVENADKAKALVETLGESVHFYKIGLQLFMADGYHALVAWLAERGKKVFVDLKFFDVPNTVGSAVRQLHSSNVTFLTVHGNDQILRAACAARDAGNSRMKILAVTMLTSLDAGDMKALGFDADIKQVVLSRAQRALEIGCNGVISSGLEAPELRSTLGENFLIIVPGIRPVENVETDDQKRTVDVEEAFARGADYIVVGRPILNDADPKAAAGRIQERISRVFAG